MDKEIKQALEVLKKNCEKYPRDCFNCDLYYIDAREHACYLFNRVPEEYEVGEKVDKLQ